MRRTWKLGSIAAIGALAVIAPMASVTATAQHDGGGDRPTTPPWLLLDDGISAPQFSLDEAIEESIFVETTVDSDLDGRRDRVHLRLSRPLETETEGIKVPVIFEHSPYRFGVNGTPNHDVDLDALPQEKFRHPSTRSETTAHTRSATEGGTADAGPNLPGSLDNYWVPRGYAVVLGESIGTASSDGCPTVGDMKETLATKAIIDWLNGRAKAWDENGPGGSAVSGAGGTVVQRRLVQIEPLSGVQGGQ